MLDNCYFVIYNVFYKVIKNKLITLNINLKTKTMKNLQELKNQIKNYFNYMFENKSKEEVAEYDYNSFLDFSSFLDEIKSRFTRNININDFSDDEIGVAYDSAIEELLNLN